MKCEEAEKAVTELLDNKFLPMRGATLAYLIIKEAIRRAVDRAVEDTNTKWRKEISDWSDD